MAAKQISRKLPHVVLVPFPLLGHLLPTMSLAKKLASCNLFVSLMCAEHRFEHVQKAHAAQGGDSRIRLVSLPDMVPRDGIILDEGLDSIVWTAESTEKVSDAFENLIDTMMMQEAAEGEQDPLNVPGPPVCIISESLISWTQDVANKWEIDRYVFDPSPASLISTLLHIPTLIAEGRLPLHFSLDDSHDEDQKANGLLINVPGLPPLHERDFHTSLQDICPKFMHEFFIRNTLRSFSEASGILINTFYDLEPTSIDSLRSHTQRKGVAIQPVGPLVPPLFVSNDVDIPKLANSLSPEDRKCLQWLDIQSQSSVTYVAFGSMGTPSAEQIHELALGLEASKQPFLWVLRQPFKADIAAQPNTRTRPPVDDLLPEGFLKRTEKQGLVVSMWAPQLLVLAHPATGSFITHCGWNSTLESICMGVPMITFPQFADQRLICRILVDQLKIGVELRRGKNGLIPKEEIAKKLGLVKKGAIEGEKMRNRARQLKAAARQAVAPEGSSQKNLEEFAQAMSRQAELRRNVQKLQLN